jgi:hypothetical protein
LLTAAQVAARLGVSRDWVYAHADRLGAVRLGRSQAGAKPRLRFDLNRVIAACQLSDASPPAPTQRIAPARRRHTEPAVPLLPIGPKRAAR